MIRHHELWSRKKERSGGKVALPHGCPPFFNFLSHKGLFFFRATWNSFGSSLGLHILIDLRIVSGNHLHTPLLRMTVIAAIGVVLLWLLIAKYAVHNPTATGLRVKKRKKVFVGYILDWSLRRIVRNNSKPYTLQFRVARRSAMSLDQRGETSGYAVLNYTDIVVNVAAHSNSHCRKQDKVLVFPESL